MKILTTIYPVKSDARLKEIEFCVGKNAALPFVERIYFLAERLGELGAPKYNFLKGPKIEVLPVHRRPTYGDFFKVARERLVGERVAICNSDVYFDHTLAPALDLVEPDWFWVLCRHNVRADGSLELQHDGMQGSADAWLFKMPLKEFYSDIQVGILGCDSYITQKARDAGLKLANPCREVILRHVHVDPERNDRIEGRTYWDKPDYRGDVIHPISLVDLRKIVRGR